MKAKKCVVVVNTRGGHFCVPCEAESISKGVKHGKAAAGFAYRVFVDGKVVRSGFCDNA